MNEHNDLLHIGCAKPVHPAVVIAGGIIVIALCILGAISMCAVS